MRGNLASWDNEFYSVVNFPFYAKVTSVWFTVDSSALDGTNIGSTDRTIRLGCVKSKNAKFGDWTCTDWALPFVKPSDDWTKVKPTIWFGQPEDKPVDLLENNDPGDAQDPQQSVWTPYSALVWRSSVKGFHDQREHDGDSWNISGAPAGAEPVRSDLSVMAPDEFLGFFPAVDGDWSGYSTESNLTLFIAYEGVSDSMGLPINPTPPYYD